VLRHLRVHRRTPFFVFSTLPAYNVEVERLQLAGKRTGGTIADGAVIDADDGCDLGTGSAEEDFVGGVELGAVYHTFAGDAIEFAMGELDHRVASDAQKNVLGSGGCHKLAIDS
jgi:hypothetical protein